MVCLWKVFNTISGLFPPMCLQQPLISSQWYLIVWESTKLPLEEHCRMSCHLDLLLTIYTPFELKPFVLLLFERTENGRCSAKIFTLYLLVLGWYQSMEVYFAKRKTVKDPLGLLFTHHLIFFLVVTDPHNLQIEYSLFPKPTKCLNDNI